MRNLTPLQWMGLTLALCGALSTASANLTDIWGPAVAHAIVSVASLLSTLLGVLVSYLSGQATQVRNVAAMPGIEKITVNTQANSTLASVAVDPHQNKVAPVPGASEKLSTIAASA